MRILKKPLLFLILFVSGVIGLSLCGNGSRRADPVFSNRWTRSSENPLIVPNDEYPDGRYDVIMGDPCVLFDEKEGLWKLWFNATRSKSWAEAENGQVVIKYAESRDGVEWKVQREPVLVSRISKNDWDYYSAETPDVVIDRSASPERRYKLWYSGSQKIVSHIGSPDYRIGFAYSADGKVFTRISAKESPYGIAGMVLHPKDALASLGKVAEGVVADPDVVLKDGTFHMWFSSFACKGKCTQSDYLGFGIGYASSKDGIHWKPASKNPLPTLAGAKAPSVIWNDNRRRFEMWFTWDDPDETKQIPAIGTFEAFGYWHGTSSSGTDWTYNLHGPRDFLWDKDRKSERFGIFTAGEVTLKDRELRLYYIAWGDAKHPGRDLIVPVRPSFNPVGIVKGTTGLLLASRPLNQSER